MTHDPQPGPWKRIAIIVFVLALGAFAFPGGLAAWLEDRNAGGTLAAPLAVAAAVDRASTATGVKALGRNLKKRFATYVGGDD